MLVTTAHTLTDKLGGVFVIRPFAAGDRPALQAMYEDFRPKRMAQGLPPDSEPALARWLDGVLEAGAHLLVEVAGEVMGHGFLVPMDGGDTVELANFLHQAVRNRGIGTRLNRALLQLAREQGRRRVWLSVEPWNRAAVRSYQKVGFRQTPGSLWAPEIEMEALTADIAEAPDDDEGGGRGGGADGQPPAAGPDADAPAAG